MEASSIGLGRAARWPARRIDVALFTNFTQRPSATTTAAWRPTGPAKAALFAVARTARGGRSTSTTTMGAALAQDRPAGATWRCGPRPATGPARLRADGCTTRTRRAWRFDGA